MIARIILERRNNLCLLLDQQDEHSISNDRQGIILESFRDNYRSILYSISRLCQLQKDRQDSTIEIRIVKAKRKYE